MTKKVFNCNYNGEAIKAGEVMIPFEYTELDALYCTNPECIKTIHKAGRKFKVIYKAVPEAYAKIGTSAFNLYQNESLGHYDIPNSVSMDGVQDEFELNLDVAPSVEDTFMEKEEKNEALELFKSLVNTLVAKSPRLAYAVLLTHVGIKGEEFYTKMQLTHDPANRIRKQADVILREGLANLDIGGLRCYKSKNDEYYREEAYKLLDMIIEMIGFDL